MEEPPRLGVGRWRYHHDWPPLRARRAAGPDSPGRRAAGGGPGPGDPEAFESESCKACLGAPLAAATRPLGHGPNLCQILWSICRVIVDRVMQSNEEMGRPPCRSTPASRLGAGASTRQPGHIRVSASPRLSRFGHEHSDGERFCGWEGRAVRVLPRTRSVQTAGKCAG